MLQGNRTAMNHMIFGGIRGVRFPLDCQGDIHGIYGRLQVYEFVLILIGCTVRGSREATMEILRCTVL